MKYKRLSLNDAKDIVLKYDMMSDTEFQDLVNHWKAYDTIDNDNAYADFRESLLACFKDALTETDGKMNYLLDLRVGLCLYQLMQLGTHFSIIDANDDDIWRYISVKIMPDITYLRYPDPAKGDIRINSKRFYRGTRRIWLKTLWWYVYLSWQGNESDTFEVLKDNATDNINKLIETPGKGYRIETYRSMMREYSKTGPHKAKEFAAITKLNNAKCISVEPELVYGGVSEYAKQLVFEVTGKDGNNNNESEI